MQALRTEKPAIEEQLTAIEIKLKNALIKGDLSLAKSAEKELTDIEQGKKYEKPQSDAEKLENLTRLHAEKVYYQQPWRKNQHV
jgi:hypothetical protein